MLRRQAANFSCQMAVASYSLSNASWRCLQLRGSSAQALGGPAAKSCAKSASTEASVTRGFGRSCNRTLSPSPSAGDMCAMEMNICGTRSVKTVGRAVAGAVRIEHLCRIRIERQRIAAARCTSFGTIDARFAEVGHIDLVEKGYFDTVANARAQKVGTRHWIAAVGWWPKKGRGRPFLRRTALPEPAGSPGSAGNRRSALRILITARSLPPSLVISPILMRSFCNRMTGMSQLRQYPPRRSAPRPRRQAPRSETRGATHR